MSYRRKQYKGGAPARELGATIDGSVLTLTLSDGTGWPTGTPGPFVIAINRGNANEERILCTDRTGTTITVEASGRGYDSTTGQTHQAGSTVEHVLDTHTIDQANRLANLLTTVGGLFAFNGTNPVELPGPPGDGSADDHALVVDAGQPTRLKFARVVAALVQSGAPSPSGPVRLWFDTTLNKLRASDSTEWLHSVPLFLFVTEVARNSALPSPTDGMMCLIDGRILERYTTALGWRPVGIPHFSNAAARDAYYTTPWTGAQAYTTGNHTLWNYRNNEWIRGNVKVTQSATAPASPQTGDIWIQPLT